MNEEKKLTDEEIVKALANNIGFGVEHTGIYRICSATIDLINRQKAEIERLTEYNANLNGMCLEFIDKNAELQKQVDELLNRRIEPKYFHCHADTLETCPKVEQAVKDKVRDILKGLIEKAYVNECIDLTVAEVKAWFREDYGVEVE